MYDCMYLCKCNIWSKYVLYISVKFNLNHLLRDIGYLKSLCKVKINSWVVLIPWLTRFAVSLSRYTNPLTFMEEFYRVSLLLKGTPFNHDLCISGIHYYSGDKRSQWCVFLQTSKKHNVFIDWQVSWSRKHDTNHLALDLLTSNGDNFQRNLHDISVA